MFVFFKIKEVANSCNLLGIKGKINIDQLIKRFPFDL